MSKFRPPEYLITDREPNISTLKLRVAALHVKLETLHELRMLLGEADLLKYKMKNLEHKCECFYMIVLQTGQSEYIFLHKLTILSHWHIGMFHHMK